MKLLVFPRDRSPFLESLHAACEERGAEVEYVGSLTPSQTLNLLLLPLELLVRRLRGWRVLHIHWVASLRFPGDTRLPVLRHAAALLFRLVLALARETGMRVAWTAHNTLPHEPVFPDDLAMRRLLVRSSDLVISLSEAGADELAGQVARPRRSVVIPHGPLAAPRARPARDDGPLSLLFFGRLAPYKGVEDLLAACAAASEDTGLCLTVAGECPDPDLRARLEALAAPLGERVSLRLERVPEAQVEELLAAHDVLVLPFRRVTNSGSALLGIGAGLPVVAPDLPGLSHLPVTRYHGGAEGLARCLRELGRLSRPDLRELGETAAAELDLPGWDEIAERTLHELAAVLDGKRLGPGPLRISVDVRYLKRRGIGISAYLAGVVDQLQRSGHRLSLVTDDAGHGAELRREHPDSEVVVLPGRSGFLWEQWTLPRHLRAADYDVHLAGANYGLPLRRVPHTRLLLIVHDLIPLQLPRAHLLERPAWAVKYLLSIGISLRRADAIVGVSEATVADVRRLARTDRLAVGYPPLPEPAPAGGEPPGSWPERYVLYNGGLDLRKNVPALIEAFARYRNRGGDHSLLLVGDGYEALWRGSEPAPAWVTLAGYVDDDLRDLAVRRAAAVAYPSSHEGFGLPLAEAMAAGVPVVSGSGGSLREVGGEAAIYVDVRDPDSIASGIELALDPAERERRAGLGREQLARLVSPPVPDPLLALVAGAPTRTAAEARGAGPAELRPVA